MLEPENEGHETVAEPESLVGVVGVEPAVVAESTDVESPEAAPTDAEPTAPVIAAAPVIPDETLIAAIDVARGALLEITSESTIGEPAGHRVEGDHLVTLYFENRLPGYPGWLWTVSLARADDGSEPEVLETELTPGEGALLAPDWLPWSDRLAEYQAQQILRDEEAAGDDGASDDDESDDDDESGFDDSGFDDADDEDSGFDDSDDEDSDDEESDEDDDDEDGDFDDDLDDDLGNDPDNGIDLVDIEGTDIESDDIEGVELAALELDVEEPDSTEEEPE